MAAYYGQFTKAHCRDGRESPGIRLLQRARPSRQDAPRRVGRRAIRHVFSALIANGSGEVVQRRARLAIPKRLRTQDQWHIFGRRQGVFRKADPEVLSEARGICGFTGECSTRRSVLSLLYGVARSLTLSGDVAQAKTADQKFFAIWKDADPGIPMLKQAKSEHTKLSPSRVSPGTKGDSMLDTSPNYYHNVMVMVVGWSIARFLSRVLEPDERHAVLGDLIESGATGGRALRSVLGLIVRRQAALWSHWRSWLGLAVFVILVVVNLPRVATAFSYPLDLYLRTYWTYGIRYATGLTLGQDLIVSISRLVALICWSWIAGCVLGSLARRTVWVYGVAVFLCCLFLAIRYRIGFPLGVLAVLLLLPAAWGARHYVLRGALTLGQILFLSTAVAGTTAMGVLSASWYDAAMAAWSEGQWHTRRDESAHLMPLVIANWPIGYLLVTAGYRRWRHT